MPVRRLSHTVLREKEVALATEFWTQALGMVVVDSMEGAAFLRLPASGNHHDLGLFAGRGAPPPPGGLGLYHLAFEVEAFDDLRQIRTRLSDMEVLGGESDHGATLSLYAADPDGIEFEVMWQLPCESWGGEAATTSRLDWQAVTDRWGR